MTETPLLIGSLSNDLFRVANLTQRGSLKGAQRFLEEAKRWSRQLSNREVKAYLKKIIDDINLANSSEITVEKAEKYLMYGILLQNYALHAS